MNEKALELLVNCLPAIIAALTCIFTTFKVIANLKDWKESNDLSSISQLEKDLKNVVKQNLELKNNITQVLAENKELKEAIKNNINTLVEEANKKEPNKNPENESEE